MVRDRAARGKAGTPARLTGGLGIDVDVDALGNGGDGRGAEVDFGEAVEVFAQAGYFLGEEGVGDLFELAQLEPEDEVLGSGGVSAAVFGIDGAVEEAGADGDAVSPARRGWRG